MKVSNRCKLFWLRHGSWVMLMVVGLICFGAGVQLQTITMGKLCSHQALKIEHLVAENARLAEKLIPAAEQAAENANRAVERVESVLGE